MQASPAAEVDWGMVKEASIFLTITREQVGEFFDVRDRQSRSVIRLYSGNHSDSEALVFEMFTNAREMPLTLSVPWYAIQRKRHDVVIRYSGYKLELFVDGVLLDEEWPMGAVDLRNVVVQQYAGVIQTILVNYAYGQTELAEIFSDEQSVREKDREYLGVEPISMQYRKPRGYNTGVGDCMPFYDGENFHIYYLFDRRGHRSKWGLGAHQWAHISTKNFKEWKYHPMAVGITEEWEGSICTGSVIRANGRYYAYYAVRAVDGSPARLTWAESQDGIHFEKNGKYIELSDNYHLASVRDPHVFKDRDGLYRMLVTTSIIRENKEQGCLAQLVSHDLKTWEEASPFIVPGYHDQPECADYFEWNGWYYLIFSNDGNARYRYSRNPLGPWLRPAADQIDGIQLRVPKTASYTGNRRIAVGFLSGPDRYGGEMVIRELVQHVDGTLGSKFLEELYDRTLNLHYIEDSISLDDFSGFDEYICGCIGEEYALSFEVMPHYANMYYGFSIADSAEFKQGYDVRFEPSARKVGIHKIHARSYQEDEVSSIYNVSGLGEKVSVEAIVKREFIDLCINDNRTIISRLNKNHAYLRFFSQFGAAIINNVKIRTFSE